LDPLIKSQLLYQLSYAPELGDLRPVKTLPAIFCRERRSSARQRSRPNGGGALLADIARGHRVSKQGRVRRVWPEAASREPIDQSGQWLNLETRRRPALTRHPSNECGVRRGPATLRRAAAAPPAC
jgi:hypothetical protein